MEKPKIKGANMATGKIKDSARGNDVEFKDRYERSMLKLLQKEFETILDTTTLVERLFESGPREYAIQFGSTVYCAHDGNGNDIVRRYGSTLDFGNTEDAVAYIQRSALPLQRSRMPEVKNLWPESNAAKNLSFVEPRENKIPTKEEIGERRKQRHADIFEQTSKAAHEVAEIMRGIWKNSGEGEIKADGAEPKPAFSPGRIFPGEPKIATFVDERSGTTEKGYIKEVKPGFYERIKEINMPLDEERRLRKLLRQIEHFPDNAEVMRTKGNEWFNYSQSLEFIIKRMREIAAMAKPF